MANPLSGRYCSLRLAAVTIASMGRWEVNANFDTAEIGEFGQTAKKAVPMMYSWTGRVEGFYDATTSSGAQNFDLLNKSLDGTLIQDLRFYVQTSSGNFFAPNCSTSGSGYSTDAGAYITNFSVTAEFNGLAKVSYDILGTGPIAVFQANSSSILFEAT